MGTDNMKRFEVIDLESGRYGVIDTANGKRVGFSFSNPPLYRDEEWNNWHSAQGFADRLGARN